MQRFHFNFGSTHVCKLQQNFVPLKQWIIVILFWYLGDTVLNTGFRQSTLLPGLKDCSSNQWQLWMLKHYYCLFWPAKLWKRMLPEQPVLLSTGWNNAWLGHNVYWNVKKILAVPMILCLSNVIHMSPGLFYLNFNYYHNQLH